MGSIYEERDGVQLAIPITAVATGTAATVQAATAIVPVKGAITKSLFVPSAAITANATNNATMTVQNKGTNGLSGSTQVAQRSWAAGNSTASQPDSLAITAANAQVAAGDVLQVSVATNIGTGVAIPAGVLMVYITAKH